jgi:hypothetical protein
VLAEDDLELALAVLVWAGELAGAFNGSLA